jgi:hypothetical protein
LMSSSIRRPLWLIARGDCSQMKVLTINLCGDREALPVFSFKEEAEMFLQFAVADKGWLVRETTTGELISVLYGPCAGVGRVALDPPPPEIFAEAMTYLVSLRRERFVRVLMRKYEKIPAGRAWTRRPEKSLSPTTLCGISPAESRRPRDARWVRAVVGE